MDKTESAQIAARVRELREVLDMSQVELAHKLGIDVELYKKYETNEYHIPISTLTQLAQLFHVDYTELLTGEAPRMAKYTMVRSGTGVNVERFAGYKFQSLAYNFKNRTMEPMLVYLEPNENEDKEPALVSHSGQEFNMCMEGTLKVVVGDKEFILNPGDSLYFDPTIPHGQRAIGGPVKFLTVIN